MQFPTLFFLALMTIVGVHGISILVRGLDGDELEIDLNEYGNNRQSFTDIYDPIFEVRSKVKNENFLVDTKSLFFSYTEALNVPIDKEERYSLYYQFENVRQQKLNELWQSSVSPGAILKLKNTKTGKIYFIKFGNPW